MKTKEQVNFKEAEAALDKSRRAYFQAKETAEQDADIADAADRDRVMSEWAAERALADYKRAKADFNQAFSETFKQPGGRNVSNDNHI